MSPSEVSHDSEPPADYTAARQSAAVFDVSHRTRLEMAGADRRNFLHNFCTNEIRGLADGSSCEAFLLNAKGRILGHILVAAEEDRLWIGSVPEPAEPITRHLETYHLLEDFQLNDRSRETGELFVTGPAAARKLCEAGLYVAELESFQNRRLTLASTELSTSVLVQRLDMLGQPGFLLMTSGSATALMEHLTAGGLVAGDADALEALRIEAGFPVYGTDLTVDNMAQEACRTETAISFTKGCYLGQEPVARIHALGHVNRELRVLEIRGETPPAGTPLLNPKDPEKEIGRLSSVGWSWERGCAVAIGLVRRQFATPEMELPLRDSSATAIVVEPGRGMCQHG